jgi:BirA family biotin operon repressor/biotin-[acetyl-CoA-carboxylase] ligase
MRVIESVALIPRVASTNLVARRIVNECIENELSLPQAMIIAGEQFAGRGRNARTWSSPAGKGIYATTLLTRPVAELPFIPLGMAVVVAMVAVLGRPGGDVGVPVVDDDARALPGEAAGDAPADPSTRAGDDGDLVAQQHSRLPPARERCAARAILSPCCDALRAPLPPRSRVWRPPHVVDK